jgi:adenine-specific DNA methylase
MHQRRLIEEAFPLKKVSEDSKHEKNVRHGHISTLHIWPARRPLAACRAAIIATLLPDPGDEQSRAELCKKIESITRWGAENGPALDFFRQEIRKAFGGRAPRVLDMFAGGGAIPLEAMRLGCEVTAIDYNPVAWFILKCTLEFPQRLAGQTWPLPEADRNPFSRRKRVSDTRVSDAQPMLLAEQGRPGDLADHVRWWGEWVLEHARQELAPYYPTVNGQPTVAYLWARTVPCPDPACGAEVPLLKTLWLCKKAEKTLPDTPENRGRPDFLRIKHTRNTTRVVINGRRALRIVVQTSEVSQTSEVCFEIWTPGPKDQVPPGTMAGAKSRCPVCEVNIPKAYIKECGHTGKMGARMTAVVVDTGHGKEYRRPTPAEEEAARRAAEALPEAVAQIPYGLPTESLPESGTSGAGRAFTVPQYGFKTWADLFTPRQLLALVTFVKWTRAVRDEMRRLGYPGEWVEAVTGYLAAALDKVADYNSSICVWHLSGEKIGHTYTRFALPMTWDFAELAQSNNVGGAYGAQLDWVARYVEHALATVPQETRFLRENGFLEVLRQSATDPLDGPVDTVITDPPYYDAIPYADIADFFYVWLRRTAGDQYPEIFAAPLTPKADELVQQSKSGEIGRKGKAEYEAGMAAAFHRAWEALAPDGRMVVVFAHKDPEAWETLVTAMIRGGLTVTASWPIDTEMGNRPRAQESAALASSIWMVCRKRPANAGTGRYAAVRRAMQERVTERLRYFWDIGISGPDFVWAAVGPALESYSAYDEVRRLDGSPFTVTEFLREVRRMVADFALGQILKGRSTEGLDEWTRYYLMHRDYFGLEVAPVGECILLSQGYGLDLNDLRGPRGLLTKASGSDPSTALRQAQDDSSGRGLRLARWHERTRDDLGEPHPSGGLPMIDMLHRLMHLWMAGNLDALNTYAAEKGLRPNELFWAVAQAVLEMAELQSRERTLLEALVAWGRGKDTPPLVEQPSLPTVG